MRLFEVKKGPWKVDYHLAYDGGGGEFTRYYKTRIGALVSKFREVHISSWGGSAKLSRTSEAPMPWWRA